MAGRITLKKFYSIIEKQCLTCKSPIEKGDSAWIMLPGCRPQWCRVLDVWDENSPLDHVSEPRPFTHFRAHCDARRVRAHVVVRGGRRYTWPTIDLVKMSA